MRNTISIAHLSDLHLPFAIPKGSEWLSKRGLSAFAWLTRKRHIHRLNVAERLLDDLQSQAPDVVAMSGDLINFGLAREFEASRAWLESLGPSDQVLAIPGNHEAMVSMWQQPMRRHWKDYAKAGCEDDSGFMQCGPVALVGVSTAVATLPFLASGYVQPRGIDQLTKSLRQAKAKGLYPVIVMHHPPTPITSRRKGLANGKIISKLIAAEGAALVLHGHTHKAELSWIDEMTASFERIPVLGVPSFSLKARTNQIHQAHKAHQNSGAWYMIRITKDRKGLSAEITQREIQENGTIHVLTPFVIQLPSSRLELAANDSTAKTH